MLIPWGWAGLGLGGTQTGLQGGKAPGTVSLLSALAGALVLAAHSQGCHGNTGNAQVQTASRGFWVGLWWFVFEERKQPLTPKSLPEHCMRS